LLTSLLFIFHTIEEYDIKINTYPTIVCKYIKKPALKVFLFYKKNNGLIYLVNGIIRARKEAPCPDDICGTWYMNRFSQISSGVGMSSPLRGSKNGLNEWKGLPLDMHLINSCAIMG